MGVHCWCVLMAIASGHPAAVANVPATVMHVSHVNFLSIETKKISTVAKRMLSAQTSHMIQCFTRAAQHSTAQHFRRHATLQSKHDAAMNTLQDGTA